MPFYHFCAASCTWQMKRTAIDGDKCTSDAFDVVGTASSAGVAACTLNDDGARIGQEARELLAVAAESRVEAARTIASDATDPSAQVRRGAVARAQKLTRIITPAGPTDLCSLLYPSVVQERTWFRAVSQRVRAVFRNEGQAPPPDLEANLLGTAVHVEHARRFLTAVGLVNWYSSSCESLQGLYNRNRSAFPVDYRSLRIHDDTTTTLLALDAFRRSGYIVDARGTVQFPRGPVRSSDTDACAQRLLLMNGTPCCSTANSGIQEANDDEVAAFQRVVDTYNQNAAKFQVSPVSIQTDLYTDKGEAKTIDQLIVDADGSRCSEGSCKCPGWQFPAATTAGAAAAAGFSASYLATGGDVVQAACVGAAGAAVGAAGDALASMFATQPQCTTCSGGRPVLCFPAVQPPPTYPTRISAQRLTDMFSSVQQTTQQIESRLDSVLQYGFAGLDLHINYVLATNDFVAALCTLTDRLTSSEFDDVSRLRASTLHTAGGTGVLDLYHDVEWNYFCARHTGQQLLFAETWGATRALQASSTVQALRAVVQGLYATVRSNLSYMWQLVTSWAKLTSFVATVGSLMYGVATGGLQSYVQWLTPQGLAQAAGHVTSQGVMALAFLAASKQFVADVWRQLTRENIVNFLRYGVGLTNVAAPPRQIVPLERLSAIAALITNETARKKVTTMLATYDATQRPNWSTLAQLVGDVRLQVGSSEPSMVKLQLDQLSADVATRLADTTRRTEFANAFSSWLQTTCANAATMTNIASIVTLAMLAGLAMDWAFVYQVGSGSRANTTDIAQRLGRLGDETHVPSQLSGRGYRYSAQRRRMELVRPPPPPIRRQ